VTYDGNGLIGLNAQVKVFEDKLISRRVSEVQISKLDTAGYFKVSTTLLRIDF